MPTVDALSFQGPAPGPNLLFLGGVHGDERPGVEALDRLARELAHGRLRLTRGHLCIVPRVNAAAVAANRRFIDENLNRIVTRHVAPKTQEQGVANALVPYLDDADVLLDLHATSARTAPFAFLDDEAPPMRAWADTSGARFVLTGWRALYPGNKTPTTTDYMLDRGKRALTVELGQKADPEAAHVGYGACLRTLAHFGLLSGVSDTQRPHCLKLTRVVYRERQGALTREWTNFDAVSAGTPIGQYEDGTTLASERDGYVVMPNPDAPLGEEWFYLAVPA